jgi:MFS family permease
MAISSLSHRRFALSQAGSLLESRQQVALVLSNALAAMGNRMQLLLHGWLIVAWGHNLLFLAAYAGAKLLPKLILALPAGILCDRIPRARVLAGSRWIGAGASLLPLTGFFLPVPMAWLIAGIVLSGITQVFDLPARRSVLGDITATDQLFPVVALNNGGSHAAALCGSLFAFVLGPAGLLLSAAFLLAAAGFAQLLDQDAVPVEHHQREHGGSADFLQFLVAAPAVALLVLLGVAPPLLDKGLALALPTIRSSEVTVSLALLAPDVGAVFAAAFMFRWPLRLGFGSILSAAACYAVLLSVALTLSHQPGVFVLGLGLAGMAKVVFDTASLVRMQESVPARLRGRVFAF